MYRIIAASIFGKAFGELVRTFRRASPPPSHPSRLLASVDVARKMSSRCRYSHTFKWFTTCPFAEGPRTLEALERLLTMCTHSPFDAHSAPSACTGRARYMLQYVEIYMLATTLLAKDARKPAAALAHWQPSPSPPPPPVGVVRSPRPLASNVEALACCTAP